MKKYFIEITSGIVTGMICLIAVILVIRPFLGTPNLWIVPPIVLALISFPVAIIKKHVIDLFLGIITGIICLILGGWINNGGYAGNLLIISAILAIISILIYIRVGAYKNNHFDKISVLGMVIFLCGIVIAYFAIFSYGIFITLASFATWSGPSL